MACPWPFHAAFDSTIPKKLNANVTVSSPEPTKSFVQALASAVSDEHLLASLPPKVVMGDSVRVKISRAAYESGLVACRTHLHGRLTLHIGDPAVSTMALKEKLSKQWPQLKNWSLTPLGKGFYEFNFSSIEEMRRIWALGTVNLKPGLLRFY